MKLIIRIFLSILMISALYSCKTNNRVDPPKLVEYHIECNPDSLRFIFDNPQKSIYIRATVLRQGKRYTGKLRIRGDSSRNFAKKSLKLKLELDNGKEEVVNLNAEYLDKSYIRQHISSVIFQIVGDPCFETSYAPVYINNEFSGLFLRVENIDKQFLKRNGFSPKGNLYKAARDGASLSRFDSLTFHWEKKTSKDESWADLKCLISDLDTCSPQGALDYVRDHFDYSAFKRHIAVNLYICNGSTYYHNYYLYRNTQVDGLWHIFPWDLDKTLSSYDWKSIYEMNNGNVPDNKLMTSLWMNYEFRNEILMELNEIENLLNGYDFDEYIDQLAKTLTAYIDKDNNDQIRNLEGWRRELSKEKVFLKQTLKNRINSLNDEIQPFVVTNLTYEPVLNPIFKWDRMRDDIVNNIEYELHLSTKVDFPEKETQIIYLKNDTSYSPNGDLPNGKWYYKVVARKGKKYITGYGRHYFVNIEQAGEMPGWQDGVMFLNKKNSPYRLRSNLIVPINHTLRIDPGVRLYIDPDVSIRVNGKILAMGEENLMIDIFSASSQTAWDIIELISIPGVITLSNLNISNGRLVFHNSNVELYNVNFRMYIANLDAKEQRPSLIWGRDSRFIMNKCKLSGNQTGEGMNLVNGYAEVKNSHFLRVPDAIEFISVDSGLIEGNWVNLSKDDAVDLNDCRNITIRDNLFSNNNDKGVSVGVDKKGKSENIEITGNYFYRNKVGCEIKDSSNALLRGNVFFLQDLAISLQQKDSGYFEGGTATINSNMFYSSKEQELYRVRNNSKIDTFTGNYVIKDSDTRSYFYDLKFTPYYPHTNMNELWNYSSETFVNMYKNDSVVRIQNRFKYNIDLGGCVIYNNNRIWFRIPDYCILTPYEFLDIYYVKGKCGSEKERWYFKSVADIGVLELYDRRGNKFPVN